jgi:hypothetical protein
VAGKRYKVQRVLSNGTPHTEYVDAWDFTILEGGVLVFNTRSRTHAFRDWIKVTQED